MLLLICICVSVLYSLLYPLSTPCCCIIANFIIVQQIKQYLFLKINAKGHFNFFPSGIKLQKYQRSTQIPIKMGFWDNNEVVKHQIKYILFSYILEYHAMENWYSPFS